MTSQHPGTKLAQALRLLEEAEQALLAVSSVQRDPDMRFLIERISEFIEEQTLDNFEKLPEVLYDVVRQAQLRMHP